MPKSMLVSHHHPYPPPKRWWKSEYNFPLYILIAGLAGLFFYYIALFAPLQRIDYEIVTEAGTQTITYFSSIFFTPIPFIVAMGLGILSIMLVPLIKANSFRDRISGASVYALLLTPCFAIIMSLQAIISYNFYVDFPPNQIPIYLTSPTIFLLSVLLLTGGIALGLIILTLTTSYMTEYLWTSIKGPIHFASGTRRTAVVLQGYTRGTVISLNHKGGYFRGMARPSKWQAYEREDKK